MSQYVVSVESLVLIHHRSYPLCVCFCNNSLAGQVTFTRTKFRTTAEVEDEGLVAEKNYFMFPHSQ